MTGYEHILLAVDLSEDAIPVGQRAVDLARHYQARLSLVHVVEYNEAEGGAPITPDLPMEETVNSLFQQARDVLDQLTERLGAEMENQIIATGSIKDEIHQIAREHAIDLIVVGSHGRHGLALLLGGSTANAVLHDTPCDVLAVRITPPPSSLQEHGSDNA